MKVFFMTAFVLWFVSPGMSQDSKVMIQQYLDEHHPVEHLQRSDISGWSITNEHVSRQSGVTHVYIRQEYDGIPVSNGLANFAIKDQKVVHMGNRLISGMQDKVRSGSPTLQPEDAIRFAASHLQLGEPGSLRLLETLSPRQFVYSDGSISRDPIPVQLMYYALPEAEMRLVWDLSMSTMDAKHWWSVRVDALNGEVLFQNDWVLHCDFDHSPFEKCDRPHAHASTTSIDLGLEMTGSTGQYAVFALPAESPIHGPRVIVNDPADLIASPFGWHDTNGQEGPEYTITRGNNVYAYEDLLDNNSPGYSPDGTAALNFIFPLNLAAEPLTYLDGAITNLFYMNNMMHDIWYHYGFDEVGGNFQQNNYGRGGLGGDYVRAEAFDGGGRNNANFGTPPDGDRPRMQMYLWDAEMTVANYLDILSPSGIAGAYRAATASFGSPPPVEPLEGEVALLLDAVAPFSDGCDSITNAADLAGKIVMIDRGSCVFTRKAQAAQDAGAIGVIFVSNLEGPPFPIGGASQTITIPSVFISRDDGDLIKASLETGPVWASIHQTGTFDSGLDNGIIAHEYGHGISNRLTGGPLNTDCLSNDEQMGEGWSDWFGLILTLEPGDRGEDVRGIGTFVKDETVSGPGIRPAPYSTSFDVNPFTYGASNNANQISRPHGVGFIFATALWDMTWALIDAYGGEPDMDFHSGTGGNNIAMHLVMEGMKLQPCRPGMIDGRDAILLADQLLYEGAHQCLIWEVFARRGFGESASQGSAESRSDQVQAFDIPPICQHVSDPPLAKFSFSSVSSCYTTVAFTDQSTSVPQGWNWDFGDGNTSTQRNPIHTYEAPGLYTVKLVVTNLLGVDSFSMELDPFALPPVPVTPDVDVCAGSNAMVQTNVTGTAVWRDLNDEIIHIGPVLEVPEVESARTFYVENVLFAGIDFAGPVDGSFGTGSYHGTGYFGAVNFTALRGFEIVSAWVDAQGAGPRTFTLARGSNISGTPPSGDVIVEEVTLDLINGPQRVDLHLYVPEAGDYTLGGAFESSTALFRNNAGAAYPYIIPGYMSITHSSANTSPLQFYYYLYDLEIQDEPCISGRDTVTVTPVVSQFSLIEDGFTVECLDESDGATSWLWDFGDGNTSGEQHPVHTYSTPGDYIIRLTINQGACASEQLFSILTSIRPEGFQTLPVLMRPNPTSGVTQISLREALQQELAVTIRDLKGRSMTSYRWPAGKTDWSLDASGWPSGMYIVQISGGVYFEVRKLIVE